MAKRESSKVDCPKCGESANYEKVTICGKINTELDCRSCGYRQHGLSYLGY
jgi:predicted RNA-binding Zn-ribbon protein involved in translation (DUF1610 family)